MSHHDQVVQRVDYGLAVVYAFVVLSALIVLFKSRQKRWNVGFIFVVQILITAFGMVVRLCSPQCYCVVIITFININTNICVLCSAVCIFLST